MKSSTKSIVGVGLLSLLLSCGPAATQIPEAEDDVFTAGIVIRNMTHDVHRFVVSTPANHLNIDCDILLEDPARIGSRTYFNTRQEPVLMSGQQMSLDTDEDRPCNLAWVARQPYAENRPNRVLVAWSSPMVQQEHHRDLNENVEHGQTPMIVVTADYTDVDDEPPPFGTRPCGQGDEDCLWGAAYAMPDNQTRYAWSFHDVQAQQFSWSEPVESQFPTCPREVLPPAVDSAAMPQSRGQNGQIITWSVEEIRSTAQEGCQEILLLAPTELYGPGWFSWHACLPDEFLVPLSEDDVTLTLSWRNDSAASVYAHKIELRSREMLLGSLHLVSGFAMPPEVELEVTGTPQRQCDAFPLDCDEVGLPVVIEVQSAEYSQVIEVGEPVVLGEYVVYMTRSEYRAVISTSFCGPQRATPGSYFEMVVFESGTSQE